MLADAGAPIEAATYKTHLLGLPDHHMVRDGLRLGGMNAPTADFCGRVLAARRGRYAALVEHEPTISPDAAAFVRALAQRIPVAIVTGAFRSEVEAGLAAAGIDADIALIVAVEDVDRGKPDPEPYLVAVQGLRAQVADLAPREVLAIEDAAPGIASAEAAGLRTASVVPRLNAEVELTGFGRCERRPTALIRSQRHKRAREPATLRQLTCFAAVEIPRDETSPDQRRFALPVF